MNEGGRKRTAVARKGHRARRLIERDFELNEGDPIGALVNWKLPARSVAAAEVKAALAAADLSLDLYAPPKKRQPYTRNEIMRCLTRNLYDYLGAVSLVEKGGAYFVPAPYLPEVRKHQVFVDALYKGADPDRDRFFFSTAIHLPGDLPHLITLELWQIVDLLKAEVKGFTDAPPRSDTLRRRVLELAAMQRKCELFDQVFGYEATTGLKKEIAGMERKIEQMQN
jgi:hypothetical protein